MPPYIKHLSLLLRPRRDERYLIIRPVPEGGTRALLLRLDVDRVLRVERFWPSFEWRSFAHGRTPKQLLPNVILAAHPGMAATILIPARIERAKDAGPIGQAEFETFLRQMHVKLWKEHRETAAEALGTLPRDAVLVDLRIANLKVEGKEVLRPFELTGQRIDMTFTITFTTRAIFETWKDLFNLPKSFFFTGVARAGLQSLAALPDAPEAIIVADEWETNYVAPRKTKEHVLLVRTPLDWKITHFRELLRAEWNVDEPGAADIHRAYSAGAVSDEVKKHIEKLYAPHLAAFDKAIAGAKLKGSAAFMAAVPFPAPDRDLRGGLRVEPFPLETLMQRFDFTIAPHAALPYDHGSYIAPLVEFYYHNRYAEVNAWLKRRIHWLIPGTH